MRKGLIGFFAGAGLVLSLALLVYRWLTELLLDWRVGEL